MSHALGAVFEFLFKYRPAVFQEGDLTLGAPASIIVLALVALAIASPAVLTYLGVRGKSSRVDRLVLGGVRIVALLLILGCLFRPMLLLSEAVPRRNYIGVVLDDSRSMRISDRGGRTRADFVRDTFGANAALLAALKDRFQVREFRFGASAQRIDSVGSLGYDQNETRIVGALEAARHELESVPLSGLVLVSDGADNAATAIGDELLALRAKGVPVFTVGVGVEHFAKDIEVQRVEAAHTVLKGGTLVADVLVRQRGYGGDTATVLVEDDGRIIAKQLVRLPEGTDAAPVRVAARLDEPGPRVLNFRIALKPGEQVVENNAQAALVRVRAAREKILYLEGEPRYETRFIRGAIDADSNLQVVLLQRTAEGKFLRLGVDNGEELTDGFPRKRAELYKYRAVILGSVEASFFTKDQLSMLADFVNVRGGGLLFLGGRRSFGEGGFAGTPLADAMPVVIDGNAVADSMTFFADLKPSLTPAGMWHAIAQIGTDKLAAPDKWRAMPAVTSVNRIKKVKPGAVTLIEGTIAAGGRAGAPGESDSRYHQPIVVYQRFGRGLAVALPIQDSWQWQMGADLDVDDQSFETFWRQMLRWLTSDVPGRVKGSPSPEQVNPRSVVELRATVADSAFERLNDAQVLAHVTAPSGAKKDVPLEWSVDRDGEYRGTFTPSEEGVHLVRIDAATTSGAAGDTIFFRVAPLNAEYTMAEMRRPLMERIAGETGGRFYTPETVSTLPNDIAMTKRGVTIINQMDLWDMPVVFLLLVILLSLEWGYRKYRGLA